MHGRPALPDRGSPRVRTAWRIVKSSAIAQGDEEAQAHDPSQFCLQLDLAPLSPAPSRGEYRRLHAARRRKQIARLGLVRLTAIPVQIKNAGQVVPAGADNSDRILNGRLLPSVNLLLHNGSQARIAILNLQ
jgi:hypothetical protein